MPRSCLLVPFLGARERTRNPSSFFSRCGNQIEHASSSFSFSFSSYSWLPARSQHSPFAVPRPFSPSYFSLLRVSLGDGEGETAGWGGLIASDEGDSGVILAMQIYGNKEKPAARQKENSLSRFDCRRVPPGIMCIKRTRAHRATRESHWSRSYKLDVFKGKQRSGITGIVSMDWLPRIINYGFPINLCARVFSHQSVLKENTTCHHYCVWLRQYFATFLPQMLFDYRARRYFFRCVNARV